jgi:hypothetical protein
MTDAEPPVESPPLPPEEEVAEADASEETTAEPVEEAPPAEQPEVYAEPQPEAIFVEPLLGLAEFVSVAGLSAPAQAALKRWLQTQRLDRQRHLTLAQWQAYHAQMLAYTG